VKKKKKDPCPCPNQSLLPTGKNVSIPRAIIFSFKGEELAKEQQKITNTHTHI
jgi:hypothetical protein